jgi:hypothetical protein
MGSKMILAALIGLSCGLLFFAFDYLVGKMDRSALKRILDDKYFKIVPFAAGLFFLFELMELLALNEKNEHGITAGIFFGMVVVTAIFHVVSKSRRREAGRHHQRA